MSTNPNPMNTKPSAIFVGMDGFQPRRPSQVHMIANRGAMTTMATALMDWNQAVGTGSRRFEPSPAPGFNRNMVVHRSQVLSGRSMASSDSITWGTSAGVGAARVKYRSVVL